MVMPNWKHVSSVKEKEKVSFEEFKGDYLNGRRTGSVLNYYLSESVLHYWYYTVIQLIIDMCTVN